jgi:2-amino-4-hydroxy-6-hydroxymethyldihydropteridine diphosphokinase
MAHRPFVLLPLAELVPQWRHPATGRRIGDLMAELPDPDAAWPITP